MKQYLCTYQAIFALCAMFVLAAPHRATAHCDTLDGPVIKDARTALEKNDVIPVLKWVKAEKEGEVKKAFTAARSAQGKDAAAREKAEHRFFTLLVKIHRAGEGAAFTGLKPAGAVEPVVAAADRALETGSADELVRLVTGTVAKGITARFERVRNAATHKEESVAAGRAFVEAYVEYTHYVERLHMAAEQSTAEKKGKELRHHGH